MADKQDTSSAKQPKDTKSLTAVSASSVLKFDLDEFKGFEDRWDGGEETVLVAPTREIQRQWRELYPGIKVLRSQRLYPLPKDYHRVTDLPTDSPETKSRKAKAK